MTHQESIWIGPSYQIKRIFILGESWFGDYADDLATDDGYIRAYLAGRVPDKLYTRIANGCGIEKREFWESVMFTNFVQRVGSTRDSRPTQKQYDEACERLSRILAEHAPHGVWVIGQEQAYYSKPIIEKAGIPVEVISHITGNQVPHVEVLKSWNALLKKM